MPATSHIARSAQGRLLEIMTAISTEKDLDVLLGMILSMARELTDAESGRIYILDPTGRRLICQVVQNDSVDEFSQHYDPVELYVDGRPNNKQVGAYCAFSGQPVRVDDVPASGAFDFSGRMRVDNVMHYHTQSLLLAPLNRPDEFTVGVLELSNALEAKTRNRIAFGQEQESLVHAFASQAAVSINNARLLEQNKRLIAVMDETNRQLEQENRTLRSRVHARCDFSDIIGDSDPMKQVFDLIEKIADTEANVLITGETGVGKELIAQALHNNGKRKEGRLVAQNCAALHEQLLESELFGYKKGAFTGAVKDKPGLFEVAHKGTLFLDEIGDMPLGLQAKLLRVLQEGEIRPLGGVNDRKIDVRIIAATHCNLKELVAEGKFREDLYYRLQVFPIHVPALSERREDLPALIQHFIDGFSKVHNKNVQGIAPMALDSLMQYDFPGNVRELRNLLERAVILVDDGGSITQRELPPELVGKAQTEPRESGVATADRTLKEIVGEYEQKVIQERLDKHGGNRTKTAEDLGISRRSLQSKIAET
ncbi:MAG: sigma 54-interacting transcriptional regulator [Gammaproteobacteria bacterium]